MAIETGAGPHSAQLSVNGGTFLLQAGSVEQHKARKVSTFSATLPMDPDAIGALSDPGDNVATITCSTLGVTGTLVTGEIDQVNCDYVHRTIQVSGRGLGAKLHEMKSSEKFLNKKGSDIAKDLAGRAGLGFSGGSSSVMAGRLLQQDYVKLSDNVSFAYIIQKCAELDGATWWVDNNGTLNYVVGGGSAGSYSINYFFLNGQVVSNALSLRISRNVQASKNIKATVKSWHAKDKKVYTGEYTTGGNGGTIEYNYNLPGYKQDHVDQHAKSRASEAARHRITVHAGVVGDPTCSVQQNLQLNGTEFAGTYEMDTVSHTVGMHGHHTSITARTPTGDE